MKMLNDNMLQNILNSSLSILHNYFDGLNKIIFRFVAKLLAKFLDTSARAHTHTNKQTKPFFLYGNYLIYF